MNGVYLPLCLCLDFTTWTNVPLLTHLNTSGVLYTWYIGWLDHDYVALRLDRDICTEAWIDFLSVTSCCALTRIYSDHHPLLAALELSTTFHHSSFKFIKAWTTHDDCRRLVLETLKKHVVCSGMHCLHDKLQWVKDAFKLRNKSVFGDVQRQVHLVVDEVNRI